MKILVIGNGLVGGFISKTLRNEGYVVATLDNNPGADYMLDATDLQQVQRLVKAVQPDRIVCAVPGFVGYKVLENSIKCGVDVVDISFGPENIFGLHDLAVEHGVTAIVDIGLAPGMPGVISGHANKASPLHTIICEVGGVPVDDYAPYFYKAPFSPIDVIEEYTRPARYKESGTIKQVCPLEGPAKMESAFQDKYPVEAILTDGLRSMLISMPNISSMYEITTRDSRHMGVMRGMYNNECFEDDYIKDTSAALIGAWKYLPGEKDRVLFNIALHDAKGIETTWMMEDVAQNGDSSMSRTTGLVATGALNYFNLNKGKFQPGIVTPELLGTYDGALEYLVNYQSEHGILYKKYNTTT